MSGQHDAANLLPRIDDYWERRNVDDVARAAAVGRVAALLYERHAHVERINTIDGELDGLRRKLPDDERRG